MRLGEITRLMPLMQDVEIAKHENEDGDPPMFLGVVDDMPEPMKDFEVASIETFDSYGTCICIEVIR
jgi:hypothetical protein